ncbi:capsid assembly scaffolding protein Gp46 family protein [Brassicibacter mesophilus]|uniref:capsid assembly scaffolding protein Gp46 family protein n=1 Tax=Brassicibacter mesophilus TaxID=745119 RepID=UPI003D235E60
MKEIKKLGDNYKFNLQLFAEEGDEGTQDEETQKQEKDEIEFDIKKILENPDFKKYMDSYADKRVTDAIKKKDKEYKQKLEDEKKKASMTAEELQKEKERELAERENTLKQYELKISKIDYFKEKDYDLDFVDYIVGTNEEEVKEKADKLMEIVNKAVEKKVQERLKKDNYTPPKGGDGKTFTLEQIKSMSPEEINKNWDAVQQVLKQNK